MTLATSLRLASWSLLVATGIARAEPVRIEVTDLAAGVAYVTPGEQAGLRIGTRVTIGGATFVVDEVNAKTALIRPETGRHDRVAIGATGTAEVVPRPQPGPADQFREQWPPARPPAIEARPEAGSRPAAEARTRVTVIGSGFAGIASGLGDPANDRGRASGELRVISTLDGMGGRPLGLDLDLAARGYTIGWDHKAHFPVFVRAAQLRYGDAIAVGRLRYAATMIGMLDGARVAARRGAFEVAAFGGVVPDALSGAPNADAARFGAEAVWDAPDAAWQPRVALALQGSSFAGELDERRASLAASAGVARVRLDGWLEGQAFPSTNPFGAAPFEIVGAGFGVAWRSRVAHASLGGTFVRPERSLRLEAMLPGPWQCSRNTTGGCIGGDYWTAATGTVGLQGRAWSVDAVASIGQTRGLSIATPGDPTAIGVTGNGSAYVRGEVRTGTLRFFLAPAFGRSRFANWMGLDAGIGRELSRIDASIAYRPEVLEDASAPTLTLHSVVGELRSAIPSSMDLAVSAIATAASDRKVLAGLVTFVWRAR